MELSNMLFNSGNKNQTYKCPDFVVALLRDIKWRLEIQYWNLNQQKEYNIFDLYMEDSGLPYKSFKWCPYNWGDDEQEYNFKYKDIEISWYKYFGRDMTINKNIAPGQATEMYNDILQEVRKIDKMILESDK